MALPYFYFDEWNLLLVTNDDASWKDAIGRTFEYWYANGQDKNSPVAIGIRNCAYPDGYKLRLKRHPGHAEKSSRDHWSYYIMFMKMVLPEEEFNAAIKTIPRMRGMNLWKKTLTGNKWAEWWYYTIFNPGAWIGNQWNNLITDIGNLGAEKSNHWWIEHPEGQEFNNGNTYVKTNTRWQNFIRGALIPLYPIQNRAWQLKFLPESKRKERQKRLLRSRCGEYNYIVRILLGDSKISTFERDNYPEMEADRSGVVLNRSLRRDVRLVINQVHCYKGTLITVLWHELT